MPDPTPPTPRAVLARAIYDQSLRDCVADGVAMAPPFEQLPQNERDDLLRQADAGLAALAASAGPLSAERLAEIRNWTEVCEGDDGMPVTSTALRDLLTAYTALAADLAALRATVAKYEAAILWALGEAGPFPPPPEEVVGKPKRRYWWRAELRRIAGLQDTLARTPTPEGR